MRGGVPCPCGKPDCALNKALQQFTIIRNGVHLKPIAVSTQHSPATKGFYAEIHVYVPGPDENPEVEPDLEQIDHDLDEVLKCHP